MPVKTRAPVGTRRRAGETSWSPPEAIALPLDALADFEGRDETPVVLEDPSSTADCLLFGFLHRLCGEPQHAAPLLRAAVEESLRWCPTAAPFSLASSPHWPLRFRRVRRGKWP